MLLASRAGCGIASLVLTRRSECVLLRTGRIPAPAQAFPSKWPGGLPSAHRKGGAGLAPRTFLVIALKKGIGRRAFGSVSGPFNWRAGAMYKISKASCTASVPGGATDAVAGTDATSVRAAFRISQPAPSSQGASRLPSAGGKQAPQILE